MTTGSHKKYPEKPYKRVKLGKVLPKNITVASYFYFKGSSKPFCLQNNAFPVDKPVISTYLGKSW